MTISQLEHKKELKRLNLVIDQVEEDLQFCINEITKNRNAIKEINQNMLSEFKFETESLVDLEGAATLWHYQSLGVEAENALDYQIKRRNALKRLNQSAYFAKITFKEDGFDEEEIYIGTASLPKKEGFEYLVYDWRAPISSIYYDFEEGKAGYEAPSAYIEGMLLNKRHFKVEHRTIPYLFDSNLSIMDDILKEALSHSADTKMKTIVTTIQKEQNQVIREQESDVLCVRGSAGSGKTSIALHRIAFLLYRNKGLYTNSNVLVFTPNEIFSDYISHVLPDLNENEARTMTFQDYLELVLKPLELKVETWYEQMDYLLSPHQSDSYNLRLKQIERKSSFDFYSALKEFINYLEEDCSQLKDITYKDALVFSKAELMKTYMECSGVIKYKSRLKQLRTRITTALYDIRKEEKAKYKQSLIDADEYYTPSDIRIMSRQYIKRSFKPIYNQVKKMTRFNLLDIYNQFLKEQHLAPITDHITYEDAIALSYLKCRLDVVQDFGDTKMVVIDEAQDYSLVQYEIFKMLFKHAKFTILGDPNQGIHPYLATDMEVDLLSHLGNRIKKINLTKTYRSTKEIFSLCEHILKSPYAVENLSRHGEKPKILSFQCLNELSKRIVDQIETGLEKSYSSFAIIGKNKAHCLALYEQYKDAIASKKPSLNNELTLLIDENHRFKNGVVIIPSYLAKGLEFDMVFICTDDVNHYNNEKERKLFYTACSRALHHLEIYYQNEQPIFLPDYE